MRIVCLVKLVPDVETLGYDDERGCFAEDSAHLLVNPDDATALSFALELARTNPDNEIETITMGPSSVRPHLEDLLRRGVHRATLITDTCFAGSDTYVTSRILARCISARPFDMVFSGMRTLDGGTSHVPAQVAELLGVAHLGNVISFVQAKNEMTGNIVEVDDEDGTLTFGVSGAAVLGFRYLAARKLAYIPRDAMGMDVSDRIAVVTNRELGFDPSEVGLAGSLTAVDLVKANRVQERDTLFVRADDAGVEAVYAFLVQHGYVQP